MDPGGQRQALGRSMNHTAKKGRSQDRSAAVLPEEITVWEILFRLPAKDLLRCRAVCRSWRRLTSAANFLRAHHRHQPPLPLVSLRGKTSRNNPVRNVDAALYAFDLRQRPTARRPVLRLNDYIRHRQFAHASCDGLILLSLSDGGFFLCNPATRQCIWLPQLGGTNVAGMYLHAASGEYRVLYWTGPRKSNAQNAVYRVLSIGSSAEPRRIGQPIDSPSVKFFVGRGLKHLHYFNEFPYVFLHDCLHWIQVWGKEKEAILVFDIVRESFRLMRYPTEFHQPYPQLLEMGGTLAISFQTDSTVKLYVLQDYETDAWSLKYQIEFPVAEMSSSMVAYPFARFNGMIVAEDGDALIHCYSSSELFHLDSKGKLMLQKFHWDGMFACATGFRFKESLVRHAFFERPRDGECLEQPQFFSGL